MSGTPMYFVRTAGCSVASCLLHPSSNGLCDTDWSFKSDADPKEVAVRMAVAGDNWACITGGEPTDQYDAVQELAIQIRNFGGNTMIQTAGRAPLTGNCWDWVAVSPKTSWTDLFVAVGNEVKIIWTGQSAKWLQDFIWETRFDHYFLQPLCEADGSTNIKEVAALLMSHKFLRHPWKLGIQQHKVWGGE